MLVRVKNQHETVASPLQVTNSVKKVRVLTSNFFSLMFCAVFMAAFQDSNVGVDLCFRVYETVFNLRRFHINSLVECCLIASTEAEMQRSVDLFAQDSKNICLNVLYFPKTERFCSVESLYYAHPVVQTIVPRMSRFTVLSGLSSLSLWLET